MDTRESRQVITIKPMGWCKAVERHLALAPHTDCTISGLPWHKANVEAGRSKVYGFFIDDKHKASMLCAVYEGDTGSEYCVEVIGGDDAHAGIMNALPGIEELAKRAKCDVVRFNTARKGLARIAEHQGYDLTDFILRKAVSYE